MLGTVRRAPLWIVSITILMVLIAATFVVDRLNDYAKDHIRAQAVLFSIEEDAAEEHIAAEHALREKKVTSEIGEDVAENRRELAKALGRLEELDSNNGRIARIRESLGAYEAAIDGQLRLVEAGRFEQAAAVTEQQMDLRFETLHEVLEDASAEYEVDARRAALVVNVATYTAALLAAIMLIALARSWQREQTRRSEQEALRRSAEHFRSLVQNASDIILIMEPKGAVRYISPAVERVLGYKREDVMGKDNFTPVHPDDMAHVQDVVAEAVENPGTTFPVELRLRHADGSWRHVESRCTSLLDDPAVGGIVFNSRDVTKRKRAEQRLRESEARYRAVIEQTVEGIYLGAADTKRVLESNAAFQEMLGYTAEELRGMHIYDFVAHDRENIDSVFQSVLDKGHSFIGERQYRRKDGSTVDVETSATVISYDNREVLCTVVRDVTERKQAEEALRRSEASHRAIVDNAFDAIITLRTDGIIQSFNRQAESMFGYAPEEAIGQSVRILVPEEFREQYMRRFRSSVEAEERGRKFEAAAQGRHRVSNRT